MVYPDPKVFHKLKTSKNQTEICKSIRVIQVVAEEKIPINQKNADLNEDRITTEELKLLHGIRMKSDNRVIIVDSFIDDKTIRGLLPLQNGGAKVPLGTLAGETQKSKEKWKKE